MANKAAVIRQPGGPEALQIEDIPAPKAPKPDQVTIRHTAIGVNYIDSYYRSGLYKAKNLPMVPGVHGVGIVEESGANVDINKGSRVSYCLATSGAYCQYRNLSATKICPIPDNITDEVAASCLFTGMTAHMLLFRVYRLSKKDVVLINGASTAQGQLVTMWAKAKGAKVIATTPNQELTQVAKRAGADHAFSYTQADKVVEAVRQITKGLGVQAVFDAVGKDTFVMSFKSLMPAGLYASFEQTCGAFPPVSMPILSTKGIYVTRPAIHVYKANTIEMALTSNEVYTKISSGNLSIPAPIVFPLEDAAKAHAQLASAGATQPIILKP